MASTGGKCRLIPLREAALFHTVFISILYVTSKTEHYLGGFRDRNNDSHFSYKNTVRSIQQRSTAAENVPSEDAYLCFQLNYTTSDGNLLCTKNAGARLAQTDT
jgi:hypothetical protein